jgi:hypothetical protein
MTSRREPLLLATNDFSPFFFLASLPPRLRRIKNLLRWGAASERETSACLVGAQTSDGKLKEKLSRRSAEVHNSPFPRRRRGPLNWDAELIILHN